MKEDLEKIKRMIYLKRDKVKKEPINEHVHRSLKRNFTDQAFIALVINIVNNYNKVDKKIMINDYSITPQPHKNSLTKKHYSDVTSFPCFYCGKNKIEDINHNWITNIDESSLHPGNVLPICVICYKMKRDIPNDVFLQQCFAIYDAHGKDYVGYDSVYSDDYYADNLIASYYARMQIKNDLDFSSVIGDVTIDLLEDEMKIMDAYERLVKKLKGMFVSNVIKLLDELKKGNPSMKEIIEDFHIDEKMIKLYRYNNRTVICDKHFDYVVKVKTLTFYELQRIIYEKKA